VPVQRAAARIPVPGQPLLPSVVPGCWRGSHGSAWLVRAGVGVLRLSTAVSTEDTLTGRRISQQRVKSRLARHALAWRKCSFPGRRD